MGGHIEHIMMVDDEDDYHLITRLMLKKAGFTGRLTLFLSAEDALAHLRDTAERPDLLLVDINMPGTNGFEFLERCEGDGLLPNKGTTVIMCSSSNRPLDMDMANRFASVHGYVEKALSVEQFERIEHDHEERMHA